METYGHTMENESYGTMETSFLTIYGLHMLQCAIRLLTATLSVGIPVVLDSVSCVCDQLFRAPAAQT